MQAIARWGNFFNQELYGTPTTLPWGIPIDCAHRIAGLFDAVPSSPSRPASTRCSCTNRCPGRSAPLVLIWLGFHARTALRPGDLLLIFFVWYGVVRFALETFRSDNWTFFGVPTAQIVSLLFVIPAIIILGWRHRPDIRPTIRRRTRRARPGVRSDDRWIRTTCDEDDDDDVDDWDDDDEDDDEDEDERRGRAPTPPSRPTIAMAGVTPSPISS